MKSNVKAEAALSKDQQLLVHAAIIENMTLMRQDFMKHLIDPKRDIDAECGYPAVLKIEDYKTIYDREGLGTRLVDIFPNESWKFDPEVLEEAEGDYTEWEKAWKKIEKEFNLYYELLTADQQSGIGAYGILLLGIDDGLALDKPVAGVGPDGMKRIGSTIGTAKAPITKNAGEEAAPKTGKKAAAPTGTTAARKLIYVRSFDQSVLSIKAIETNVSSPRYGMPTMYAVNTTNEKQGTAMQDAAVSENKSMDIHWTRCIHIADGCKNSKVYGTPRLQDVFNRVYDGRKTLGGSGEMFWKGGFPGISFETTPEAAQATMSEPAKKIFRQEIADYQNGMQRYLMMIGMTAKSLAPQVADPGPHFETQCKAMAMTKGIPYRIFMGTEESKLAGGEDTKAWNDRIHMRREKYLTPRILVPVVRRLMAMGVLEELEDVIIAWPPISKPSKLDQSTISKNLTEAIVKYIQANADVLIQPLEFLTQVLDFDTETAQAILEKAKIADDGTLDDAEVPTPMDDAAAAANIELTKAKAIQAKRPPPRKGPTRNDAGDLTEAEKRKRIAGARKRLKDRLKL